MVGFPKRTKQHEIDSKGVSILKDMLCSEFVFREISERDYGIDALLEIVGQNGDMIGKFVNIQIKSSADIYWNEKDISKLKIKNTTINYWLQNTNPVLLILVDVIEKKAFAVNAKRQVRKKYNLFLDNKMSFEFTKENEITSKNGYIKFFYNIISELNYHSFMNSATDYIMNSRAYHNHIICNQNRDCFLPVDHEVMNLTMHLFRVFNNLNFYLKVTLPSIDFHKIRH